MEYLVSLILLLLLLWGLRHLGRFCLAANRADWGLAWVNRLDGCVRRYCRRWHRLQPRRLELPPSGPAIVVSNHVSGLDPLLMVTCSRRPLRFLIAREQYRRHGLQWLFRAIGCIPVDRQRSPEKALRAAFKALRAGQVVALFPHGKIHLDTDPPRKLKAGAARLAMHTGASLFPMRITGVRGQGRVFSPLLLRSRARVSLLPPIDPRGRDPDEVLAQLQRLLDHGL